MKDEIKQEIKNFVELSEVKIYIDSYTYIYIDTHIISQEKSIALMPTLKISERVQINVSMIQFKKNQKNKNKSSIILVNSN